jgi:excisionase family DNA binding protein
VSSVSVPDGVPIREFESLKTASGRTEISIYTLREKIDSGELPAYRFTDKPGASIRVRVRDVDALLRPFPVQVSPDD